jgi:hypothetical protein
MKLTDIKYNPNNPRIIKDNKFFKLVNSILEFPKMMELRPMVYDEENIIQGGNMRSKALLHIKSEGKEKALKHLESIGKSENISFFESLFSKGEIPDNWTKKARDLTEEEKRRFVIADNIGFGEWDNDILTNEWDSVELEEWGMDLPGFDVDSNEFGEDFSLKDGDKAPFQQMTFTLADEQAEQIKNAIADIKKTEEYKYAETMGNENSNGNALYLIIMQWAEQRK